MDSDIEIDDNVEVWRGGKGKDDKVLGGNVDDEKLIGNIEMSVVESVGVEIGKIKVNDDNEEEERLGEMVKSVIEGGERKGK